MKSIDELGISPHPWTIVENEPMYGDGDVGCEVIDAHMNDVTASGLTDADAQLICIAPELYECLRDACNLAEALSCQRRLRCKGCDIGKESCALIRWRRTLAKAAGERSAE